MSNPNTPTAADMLRPCVLFLSDYLGKIDRNGQTVFLDEVETYETPADLDVAGLCWCLTETLRTRFQVDVIEVSGASHDPEKIENLEERENAFAVLERAEAFSPQSFAAEFLRLAPFILRNTPAK